MGFRDKSGDMGIAKSPYAKERLRRTRPIVAEDFRFLKDITNATPKVTIPSPPVMHYFLGPRAVDEAVYPDMEVYYADLAAIYRDEIAELGDAGCTLDDVVKANAWLPSKGDFLGFNKVYGEYFPKDPPARSTVISGLMVDVKLEVEVTAYKPR